MHSFGSKKTKQLQSIVAVRLYSTCDIQLCPSSPILTKNFNFKFFISGQERTYHRRTQHSFGCQSHCYSQFWCQSWRRKSAWRGKELIRKNSTNFYNWDKSRYRTRPIITRSRLYKQTLGAQKLKNILVFNTYINCL